MESLLLEFRVHKDALENKARLDDLISDLRKELQTIYGDLTTVTRHNYNCGQSGFIAVFQTKSFGTVLLQGNSQGLLTIDIHSTSNGAALSKEQTKNLRKNIQNIEGVVKRKTLDFISLPPIKRGQPFSQYDLLSFGSFVEYDFDELVFDEDSPYQNVRILHSKRFGNCLMLDNDMNLAESDLSYTIAITGDEKENYKDKNVLVLGGGDGGILNYLKDKGPRMITMIDIDRVVIDAAKIHLRGICGDAMDEEEGDNYKIIVDDCVKHLVQFSKSGHKFDYVINDLTAIPISEKPVGSHWDFLKLILNLSLDVLKDDGKYFTQGNGALNVESLEMYENVLSNLKTPVGFSKQNVAVPSYMESWVFYTLWKTQRST